MALSNTELEDMGIRARRRTQQGLISIEPAMDHLTQRGLISVEARKPTTHTQAAIGTLRNSCYQYCISGIGETQYLLDLTQKPKNS